MKTSKITRILGSLILATGLTMALCLIVVISRCLNLLPVPWGDVANIAFGILILTIVIYTLITKATKDEEE